MSDSFHDAPFSSEVSQTEQASAKTIAEALRRSEIQYRRLFEASRDGILILESEKGQITDANPFMTELLGYAREELIGKELWEIGLLKDKEAGQLAFRQLKQEGYIRYEDLPLENLRGELKEVEFVSSLYREDGITVIQCNIRDITDRKGIELQLATVASRNERIAETLQRSMLLAPPAGKFRGLDVETFYAAAMHEANVGGDFFDAFALSDGRVGLVVGDVSGKGLVAAGRTAEVKYALRAFLHEYKGPEVALARLNEFICETHRLDKNNGETFIVLAVAVMDTDAGRAHFSTAGAEPTLILRQDGTVEAVEITGCPLGIASNSPYIAKSVRLAPGETIIMATDGITEARRGYDFLGSDGLAALAEKAGPSLSLRDLIESLYIDALEFSGKGLNDDVCLLLARCQ